MKIWVPAGEEGWLLSAESESWNCTQKLDLKSSTEPRAEMAFFNQITALSEAGLLLLANAKRNAIYAVHLDYGSSPADTRMDFLSEFTVTMPILSFIGTHDPSEEPIVKVYCVQTQAIQQYTLDLCLCLPPSGEENVVLEKSDSSVSREANLVDGMSEPSGLKPTEFPSVDSVPKPSILVNRSQGSASGDTTAPAIVPSNSEPRTSGLLSDTNGGGSAYATAAQLPLSPRLSSKLSGYQTPVEAFEQVESRYELSGKAPSADYGVDKHTFEESSSSEEKNITPDDDESGIRSSPSFFKHPTHLVKPSEFSMGVSSAETPVATEDKSDRVNNDASGTEIEASEVGEVNYHEETMNGTSESREKIFYSQALNLSTEMARDCYPNTDETKAYEQSVQADDSLESRDVSAKIPELVSSSGLPQLAATNSKGKKQKAKSSQNPNSSADSYNEKSQSLSHPLTDSLPQFLAMQETMNQVKY